MDRELLPPSIQALLDRQASLDATALAFKNLWEQEAHRYSELLRSLMPSHVVGKLRSTGSMIAEGHADVSILFADIVSFTSISGDLTPHGVVDLLEGFFNALDELCDRHRLEKIKTIGDAYMLAGGLDPQDDGSYTERVLRCAQDIVAMARQHPPVAGRPFEVRVGVGTGPVVAGVIGKKRITYDLWGDTVNIAARMCSAAPVQGIAIDDMTQITIAERFTLSEPETLEVKGKGQMQVYCVLDEKAP